MDDELIADIAEAVVSAGALAWQRDKCAQCGHPRFRHEDRSGFWNFWWRNPMDGPCDRCDCQRFGFA